MQIVSIKIRKDTNDDLDKEFHNKCFKQNLEDSYVVEKVEATG